ncbi:MAG: hypothetical protein ABFS35_20725 [Bacteroidota bacterium]
MKKNLLNYTSFLLVAILIFTNCYSQGIQLKTDQSKYPAFDKLFKLKWEVVDKYIGEGELLLKNGLVFAPGAYKYCLDGKTGNKLLFSNEKDRLHLRKNIQDSILTFLNVYESMEKTRNVFTGKNILSGEFSSYESFLLDTKIIKDSIFFYPLASRKKLMAKDLNKPRRVLWVHETESDIIYKYQKFDSLFVVFTVNKLLLLNAKTGIKEWETPTERLICNPVLIDNNFYFITAGQENINTLYSFNLHERKKNWSLNFESTCGYYGLAAENDKLSYVSGKGVHILDAMTGKELSLTKGDYEEVVVSIVDDYVIVYNTGIESVSIGTAIDLNSGKIEYQYFTSKGFPPLGEDDMSELGKEMKERGDPDWWEGLGYNYLDGTDVHFVKDPTTGLIYGNGGGVVYCLEYLDNKEK